MRASGNGTYTAANVQAGLGGDRYAGWSLVVAYELVNSVPRNLTIFDGFALVNTGAPNVTFPVSGFLTPPSGVVKTRLGTVSYDGDREEIGDNFRINGNIISNSVNPVNNYFNSTISDSGVLVQGVNRNPNYNNQLGFDIDRIELTGIVPNSATSASINLTTGGEAFYPGVVTFSTDLYLPNIPPQKTAVDVDGGALLPGDIIEYRVLLQNTGNDAARTIIFTDILPANTTYVPNSIVVTSGALAGPKTDAALDDQAEFVAAPSPRIVYRPGAGATGTMTGMLPIGQANEIRFRVQVNQGTNNQQVINQPSITYTGVTSGLPTGQNGEPVALEVAAPNADLSITKTNGTNFVADHLHDRRDQQRPRRG